MRQKKKTTLDTQTTKPTFLHKEWVEHGDPLAKHGDLQLVFRLEMLHELLHRHLGSIRLHRVDLKPEGKRDGWQNKQRQFYGYGYLRSALFILYLLPVPKSPLCLVILVLWCLDGFGESKEREGEVGESVLVHLDVGVPLQELVQLEGDQAGYQGGRRCNGRNDTSSDTLGHNIIKLKVWKILMNFYLIVFRPIREIEKKKF